MPFPISDKYMVPTTLQNYFKFPDFPWL